MKAVSLSLQEKQLAVVCANDKFQAFKQILEFQKTCICHDGLDSFLKFKDFSDEIDGDIYKCGFLILCNEMGQHFWKLCVLSEPILTKDNTKSFMGKRAMQSARDASGF